MDYTQKLTHISLCTGYGGIDLGLRDALRNVRTITYVEIEAFAVENLVSKIEAGLLDPAPIFSDLKSFPWRKFAGRVDILSGGFPCQPFSSAGRNNADTDPRHLWPSIRNGIIELRKPPIIFFENVEGIISSTLKSEGWADPKGTPVLLHILREMERMGYYATARTFSAAEVGAPHQRKRVFILGIRHSLPKQAWESISKSMAHTQSNRNKRAPSAMADSKAKAQCQEDGTISYSCHKTSRFEPSRVPDISRVEVLDIPKCSAYAAPRGSTQYWWEPPRLVPKHKPSISPQDRTAYERWKLIGSNTYEYFEAGELGDAARTYGERCTQYDDRSTFQPNMLSLSKRSFNTSCFGVCNRTAFFPNKRGFEIGLSQFSSQDDSKKSSSKSKSSRQEGWRDLKSSLGRNPNGNTYRMDYEKLCKSMDSQRDELRLLGNGVVPQTASRAFKVLFQDLYTYVYS